MKNDGITFFGDVFLPEPYKAQLPWLGQYVFNLESPITQSTVGHPGKINLKVKGNYSTETFGHPPIAVTLANNHILDYEQKGLDETLLSLKNDGIQYFGAGDVTDNCNNPAWITSEGCRIALLGYVYASTSPVFAQAGKPGVAPINAARIAQDIIAAKEQGAERVIVSVHWGAEQIDLPKPDDVLLAHAIIDAGADLLIGHHAHCVQPWELYKGKYIFYGLGNCIFPDIDVPGFYQGETPTKRHSIHNKFWNKRSLAVKSLAELGEYGFQQDVQVAFFVKCRGASR